MDFSKYLGSLASGAQKSYGGLLSGLSAPSLSLSKPAQPAATAAPTASPSASNPAPTSITSPTSSPAKQQYMASVAAPSQSSGVASLNPTPTAPPTTPAYLQPGYRSPGQIADDNAAQNGTSTTNVGATTSQSTDPMSSYIQYLKGYQDKANAANTALADVQTKQEQAQTDARRGYDATLDTSGATQGGNQVAAAQLNRRNNANLADIALQESAAARTAGVAQTALGNAKPLQIGDNYYDPSTGKLIPNTKANAGFTLSAGQTQYQLDPTTGQYKAIAGGAGANPASYTLGANPAVDQWAQNIKSGSAKLSDVPAELKTSVSSALAQTGSSQNDILGTTTNSLSELQNMVDDNKGFEAAVGLPDVFAHPINFVEALFTGSQGSQLPGTDAANFVAKLNQVKNDVILPNLNLLHGLGRVTDREFQALTSAVTALGPNLSESQFKTELKNITDQINAKIKSAGSRSNSTPPSGNNAFAEQW